VKRLERISALLLLASGFISCQKGSKPNIIVFLIDDAGYADFGFNGSPDMPTPNIDKLARSGVIFTDAHTSASVCGPSRAGLLSGRYQQSFGFECNDIPAGMGIDPDVKLLSAHLREAGYTTAAIGKWHLGNTEAYLPNNRGFDEFYGFLGGARSYFPKSQDAKEAKDDCIFHNTKATSFDGYLTDRFGDFAVEFIHNHSKKPFFIYFSPNAVHAPMEAKEELLALYSGSPRPALSAMMHSLDENIGRIIDKLKEKNIYDNTLIFFLSDNGGALSNDASCAPWKGWKGTKYEGGHRVPFFVVWENGFRGGQIFNELTSSLDIFSSAMAAADVPVEKTDGVNLLPFLKNKNQGNPHEILFWRKGEALAVRENNWKLIRLQNYGSRLYNLSSDPAESEDLSFSDQQMAERLLIKLNQWEGNQIPPLWLETQNWNEVNKEVHEALMENRDPRYKNPSEMKKYQTNSFVP